MREKLSFTVDSALLEELGEKLVETVHIALVELVKNSYDADASEVEVLFTKNNSGSQEIRIIDNGKGMNFDAVQNYWMRIATTNKEKSNVSTVYGRPLTGAKGVGRFSCRRLGGHLTLITSGTSKGNKVGKQQNTVRTEVVFPWKEFKPGTDVTDITCDGNVTNVTNTRTGTTLIINDITEEWDTRGWNWLKRQLSVLAANTGINRNGFKPDPGFSIKITAPDFEGGIRDIREDYMNAGWGTLTAQLNAKHQAVCVLEAKGLGKKTITSLTKFPNLQDINLRVGIMVNDRSQMRDTSTISLANMQQILPDWGGVQVKYKNFRVFPYGDDDWLDIDRDRGIRKAQSKISELSSFARTLKGVDPAKSLLNMLSMRSYMGSVFIGENAKGFEMKLNREGFVYSKSVEELKQFVRYAIDWSTILRDYYLRQTAAEESKLAVLEFELLVNEHLEPTEYVDAAIDYIESEVRSITRILPENERNDVNTSFFKATELIKKHNSTNKAELNHLRLIASTSTLLLIFSHEVKSLLGLLEQTKNSLKIISSKLEVKDRNKILETTKGFTDLKARMEDLLEMTSLVGVEKKQSKTAQVALKDRIVKVEKVFALVLKKYNIILDYSKVANNIAIKNIFEAEIYSILLNTISNAIKSVIAAGKKRVIEIAASRENGYTNIHISDTGLGLDPSNFDEVFIPFISDPQGQLYNELGKRLNPEDKLIVGSGSGLGLGIVKEIVAARQGTIKFVNPTKGWKAVLEIKLP